MNTMDNKLPKKAKAVSERINFYRKVVSEKIDNKNASILVCGGGNLDKEILDISGFTNVTISNLDERMEGNEFAPFRWKYENAESLSFNDESFDYVIIHAAIHHTSSPHKALTEMYRVSKKGALALESRDSIIMRILERIQFTLVYEHAAVYYNNCKYGGVNNTEIPNFIYRWTEREIEKTIKSYAPYAKHKFHYKYGTAFPYTPELETKGNIKYLFIKLIRPLYWLFSKLFPKQQNLFAFYIEKPAISDMIFPWLKYDKEGKITFNRKWGDQRYKSPTNRCI